MHISKLEYQLSQERLSNSLRPSLGSIPPPMIPPILPTIPPCIPPPMIPPSTIPPHPPTVPLCTIPPSMIPPPPYPQAPIGYTSITSPVNGTTSQTAMPTLHQQMKYLHNQQDMIKQQLEYVNRLSYTMK